MCDLLNYLFTLSNQLLCSCLRNNTLSLFSPVIAMFKRKCKTDHLIVVKCNGLMAFQVFTIKPFVNYHRRGFAPKNCDRSCIEEFRIIL